MFRKLLAAHQNNRSSFSLVSGSTHPRLGRFPVVTENIRHYELPPQVMIPPATR